MSYQFFGAGMAAGTGSAKSRKPAAAEQRRNQTRHKRSPQSPPTATSAVSSRNAGIPPPVRRSAALARKSTIPITHPADRQHDHRAPEPPVPSASIRRAPQTTSQGRRLIQAPIAVASASPTCASGPISRILNPILTADRDQRGLHRRRGVAARKEWRGHAADQHEREQTERIGRKRCRRRGRIGGGEGAAQEQRAHDQLGDDQEGDNARN